MIIGIGILENTLDATKEDQIKTYLSFVESCMKGIKNMNKDAFKRLVVLDQIHRQIAKKLFLMSSG